ncbi:MAG: CapA family protein [Candidatus Cryptobacteroides sp.]|jgi:poly-gamma-glutamate capsule biosynthesis protein CapA/YwtB (metallophosphatase superfamily)
MRNLLSAALLSLLAIPSLQAQPFGSIPWPKPLRTLPDTATLVFLGDIMMHQDQIDHARQADGTYNFQTYFKNLEKYLQEADVAVANMEFTLAGKPYTGYPSFSAPDNYPDEAADAGVNIFLTANNHILDKGKKGIERTLDLYSRMERDRRVKFTGSARDAREDSLRNPLIIAAKGVRIALLNFTYGTNLAIRETWPKVHRIDTATLSQAIQRAKASGVDYIIALPHWGTEYVLRHNGEQRKLAIWLADQGCDAIIGSHPHVAQDIEILTLPNEDGIGTRDVPVAYSLGNAISNMSAINTRIGILLTLRIVTDAEEKRRMLPPEPTFTWCALPGTLTPGYTIVPVREYAGKRQEWLSVSDYENMMSSYRGVKEKTGITDGEPANL